MNLEGASVDVGSFLLQSKKLKMVGLHGDDVTVTATITLGERQ